MSETRLKSATRLRARRGFLGENDRIVVTEVAHQVRYLTRVFLRSNGIEAEDECELEDTANTGICISHPKYLIRVLRDTNSGSLPKDLEATVIGGHHTHQQHF